MAMVFANIRSQVNFFREVIPRWLYHVDRNEVTLSVPEVPLAIVLNGKEWIWKRPMWVHIRHDLPVKYTDYGYRRYVGYILRNDPATIR